MNKTNWKTWGEVAQASPMLERTWKGTERELNEHRKSEFEILSNWFLLPAIFGFIGRITQALIFSPEKEKNEILLRREN